jgi:prephenate dehydrogenase
LKISIIGTGLLGASVALAAKESIRDLIVCCYDKSAGVRETALKLSVCDEAFDSAASCVKGSDIVIIASPIFTFKELYLEIKDAISTDCIVTDTGSTKTMPLRWAPVIFGEGSIFIGSHPIAGSEKNGIENASSSIIKGAKCIVTEHNDINKERLGRLLDFWKAIGCETSTMSTERHDKLYAVLSHLPHATAAALLNVADDEDLTLAGNGFKDVTRIAQGNPEIWEDIFLSNAENVNTGIDKLIASLQELKHAINDRSRASIASFLTTARDKRSKIR